jgi:hypothetical protein
MRNKPFSSSSHASPPEWKSEITTVNNVTTRVYQPVDQSTPVVITAPSFSVGNDPTFSVNKIKRTVAEILADNIHAPITCQALINSADTAVFASTNSNGYHLLPVSGRKIHEHFSSGNIPELKTSGTITAAGDITTSGNVVATNIKNFYQTVNSANNTVGDKGSQTQITNAGCPSSASDWTRYLSWKTSSADTMNSNPNVFSPQNYGFKSLVAGTYKITVNMAIQAEGTNQSIVIRLAKNTLNDEVADSDQENPGALAGTGYLPGFTGSNTGKINSFGSASITHIMTLSVNDEVSVYTVNTGQVHGSGVNSHTREGYSQFLAEYLG